MKKNKRLSEYKPLLFTTTLRNPERMKKFLKVLAKYDRQILTNELINKIVNDLVSSKLYVPVYVKSVSRLKMQLVDEYTPFSVEDTNEIIRNSPQSHKEAGFDEGWPSRFDTWYKFLKELGFVYYEIDKPIIISETGSKLVLANEEGYEHLETQAFLNAFVKYQRINPYRRILNDNKPLLLLLNTITELRKRLGESFNGISINEIPLFICWKDSNYQSLADKILEIRELYGFRPSSEYIYSICKEILELTSEDEKRFKISNITEELPDEFIRKMRLTGVISLRGMGRFIDVNQLEMKKVEYIIEKYNQMNYFDNESDYFDYMKSIDSELINSDRVIVPTNEEKYKLFNNWVEFFELNVLMDELSILTKSNGKSKNEIFKYISEPLRLEFLTALSLQKKFKDIIVNANYSVDDEGLPTSFASGGNPDIVCMDKKGNILFEVTMIVGAQQCIREMNSIFRHLNDCVKVCGDSFSVLLAPKIHEDTVRYADYIKYKDKLDIIPIDIPEFIKTLKTDSYDIRDYKIG